MAYQVMKVDRNDTVAQLEGKVSELTGLPQEDVVIMLRHEQFQVRVELFNMDWCRPKKLSEMRSRLDHGHCLFVENNDDKKKFDLLGWYRAMMNHENIWKLYISFEERSI